MENAPDFKTREDQLCKYLESNSKDFLFDEFSKDYLLDKGLDFLEGIAVPFRASDMIDLQTKGIDPSSIVDNMAMVVGSNTKFPYADKYIKFMAKFFNEHLVDVYCSNGAKELVERHFRVACAYYRMALMLDSKNLMAMFGYACTCREWYLDLEGEDDVEDLITILKSESTAYYEWAVIEHPQFAPSYYYLGFAYLNAALYSKSQFIWTRFVELSMDETKPEVQEIKSRLAELVDPAKIEEGVNKLTTGDLESGLKILEPYVDSQYGNWWPLHFYLASAYRELGHPEEAIEGFKRVLSLDASNYDACVALSELYDDAGDEQNKTKYAKKSEIILQNRAN